MTTQTDFLPCRAKGTAPSGQDVSAATSMRFPPQSPCSLPENAANRIVPAAPGGRGPALSEREGKMQTPSIPLLKEERKNRTPPFPAYCVGLPQPAHFTRQRPALIRAAHL